MDYHEEINKKDREKNPPKDTEIKGPTLNEILRDREKFDLFGKYLDEEGDLKLGKKIAEPEQLTPEDRKKLAEKRTGFLELMDRSKNILDSLDLKTIKELANISPELRAIAETSGADTIREAMQRHAAHLAITDRGKFRYLEEQIMLMKRNQELVEEGNKEIEKIRKQLGISEKDYLKILNGEDIEKIAKERHNRLSVYQKMFGDKNLSDFQQELEDAKDGSLADIRRNLENLRKQKEILGNVLAETMNGNEALSKALDAGLRGESLERPEPGMSFAEWRALAAPDGKASREAWEKRRKDFGDEKMKDSMERAMQEYKDDERYKAWDRYFNGNIEAEFHKKKKNWEADRESKERQFIESEILADSSLDTPERRKDLKKTFDEQYVPPDGYSKTLEEFSSKFKAREREFYEEWLKDYKDPTPDAEKLKEIRARAENYAKVSDEEHEKLASEFADDQVATVIKNKKAGFWGSIFSSLFRDGIIGIASTRK